MINTKFFDYLKEPLRWVAIAVVAWLVDVVVPGMKQEYIPYVMIGLRFVDKMLHDWGKDIDSDALKMGLTRF